MTKQARIIIATMLFLTVTVIDIWAVINQQFELRTFSKPLLMPFLALVYLVATDKPNLWFVLGLFFSFLGDVFLLFSTEQFFMFGLGSFLLAHVMYIKITASFLQKKSITIMLTSALPFVLLTIALLFLIKDNLGTMLLPVVVYGLVISTFGAVALLNYRSEKSTANLWLFLGASLFIISDSMIAINRFYEAKEMYALLIMLTYIIAQYLICKAMIAKSVESSK